MFFTNYEAGISVSSNYIPLYITNFVKRVDSINYFQRLKGSKLQNKLTSASFPAFAVKIRSVSINKLTFIVKNESLTLPIQHYHADF